MHFIKTAIIGSRTIKTANIEQYIPVTATEIVSGGAKGVDTAAKNYAVNNGLEYTEFLPEYDKYSRAAPIVRNKQIVEYSDFIIALWDGKSKGTKSVIDYCKKLNKDHKVYVIKD